MTHWSERRKLNTAEFDAQSLDTVRRHPLALSAEERARLEATGAIKPRATILDFLPMAPARTSSLRAAAEFYLLEPRPQGFAKSLAVERGLNYGSLLTSIGNLRARAHSA